MQEFFKQHHGHVTLLAHHCLLPIHILVAVGHYYIVASIASAAVLVTYAVAAIYHERQVHRYE